MSHQASNPSWFQKLPVSYCSPLGCLEMPFVSRRKKPASYCPSHYEWLFPLCGSEGIPDMAGELSKPRHAFSWLVPCHLIISDLVTSLSSAQTSLSLLVTIITHALVFNSTTFTELPEWVRFCCEQVEGRTRRGNQTCACFQGAYRPGREWTAVPWGWLVQDG